VVGKTVSHYRILEKIGQGGMGEVYLAQDTTLDRKVALKFLPEELEQDPTTRKRFLREAKSAAALDHPYVCQIHEVGEVEGKSFISMEYVQGTTLKEKLTEGPLPINEALEKAAEIAEALEEAHKQGIVHRDLKPANIMLTLQGHVKVMDFGLAKQVTPVEGQEQEITTALTQQGSTLGTVPYMSPEQVRGQEVDTRSDIFSFGVVLYEMLTGVNPPRQRIGHGHRHCHPQRNGAPSDSIHGGHPRPPSAHRQKDAGQRAGSALPAHPRGADRSWRTERGKRRLDQEDGNWSIGSLLWCRMVASSDSLEHCWANSGDSRSRVLDLDPSYTRVREQVCDHHTSLHSLDEHRWQ